jgi:flagellar basal-body rod protein FlgC
MTMFGAIHTAGSGLQVFRTWMDAVSDNIANINDVKPTNEAAFQARFVVAQAKVGEDGRGGIGTGAEVAGVQFGNSEGRLVHEPTNPIADANGMVRYPDVDLGDQMTQMIMAQRSYQANLAVVDRAKDAYQQALELGK